MRCTQLLPTSTATNSSSHSTSFTFRFLSLFSPFGKTLIAILYSVLQNYVHSWLEQIVNNFLRNANWPHLIWIKCWQLDVFLEDLKVWNDEALLSLFRNI